MFCRKVGAFYRIFFAKEGRKTLKGKPGGKFQVDLFAVCQISTSGGVPTKSFYNHVIV